MADFDPPLPRPGAVQRARLLQRLAAATDCRVISIVTPPGYGKTTALGQWAAMDPRAIVWLTADESHNDVVSLFTDLATAFDRHWHVDDAVFDAIGSPELASYRLAGQLLAGIEDPTPALVVIDDAHRITDESSLEALGELIARVPVSWQVALAGRDAIALPLGRWRAQASLLDIGVDDLAMDRQEATDLVRGSGLAIPPAAVAQVIQASRGWAAVAYLATLRIARPGGWDVAAVSGRDDLIADFLRSELLDGRTESDVTFLTRTSLLERLNGRVCDAVVGASGSGARLERLARSTLLVDESGGWFRYHTLMREFLRGELERREPERVAELHRLASAWYEREGLVDLSVEHAFAASDLDLAAANVGRVALRYHWSGRRATVRAWLNRFGDAELEARPWLAVLGALEEAGIGDVQAAEHLADIVERGVSSGRPLDGTASFESGRAMLRAIMCRHGLADMLANATRAAELERAGSPWRDLALWTVAFGRLIAGEISDADEALADTVAAASANRSYGTWQCALAQRALLAMDRGDWSDAQAFAEEADAIVIEAHLEGYQMTALTCAALARIAVHRGDLVAAREQLARATILRPQLTASIPWLNVTALLGLARAFLAVDDPAGARTLLAQANDVIRLRRDLGVLPAEVHALREQIAALPIALSGASTLTAAELRVLSYLPLYLSFKEIGQRLGVKASTVQTHATAIYGKLGASTRGEAVDLAIGAGLLEGFPNWQASSHQRWEAPSRQRS